MAIWALFPLAFCIALLPLSLNAQPHTLRDPTQPPVFDETKQTYSQSYSLQAIINSGNRNLALINNNYVNVGEVVDGALVMQIKNDSVDLTVNGKRITIYLLDTPLGK